ncbi:calcium-binding protein CML38-like [Mercurialis annua]|uniref:calcium-binding protein CML38-like n=1 Tax=Mercurialis annua TaxID=3986 RepID=UPI00215F7F04|nr:calcium-binding protein CML38-like [Mercurialis annua]
MPLSVPKSAKGSFCLTEEQLKAMFKDNDSNGDGLLSKEEVKKTFQLLGSRLPDWRVKRALRRADADGDGNISMQELSELVKYAGKLGYTLA